MYGEVVEMYGEDPSKRIEMGLPGIYVDVPRVSYPESLKRAREIAEKYKFIVRKNNAVIRGNKGKAHIYEMHDSMPDEAVHHKTGTTIDLYTKPGLNYVNKFAVNAVI